MPKSESPKTPRENNVIIVGRSKVPSIRASLVNAHVEQRQSVMIDHVDSLHETFSNGATHGTARALAVCPEVLEEMHQRFAEAEEKNYPRDSLEKLCSNDVHFALDTFLSGGRPTLRRFVDFVLIGGWGDVVWSEVVDVFHNDWKANTVIKDMPNADLRLDGESILEACDSNPTVKVEASEEMMALTDAHPERIKDYYLKIANAIKRATDES